MFRYGLFRFTCWLDCKGISQLCWDDFINQSGCFQKQGEFPPNWMVKIKENPIFWLMILGENPLFSETPIRLVYLPTLGIFGPPNGEGWTCIAGVWVLKIAFFEGSGFLGYMNRGGLDKLVGKHTIHWTYEKHNWEMQLLSWPRPSWDVKPFCNLFKWYLQHIIIPGQLTPPTYPLQK